MAESLRPEVALSVAGRRHLGWKEARVVRSLERAAGSFELVLSDRWRAGDAVAAIVPGAACSVALDGETVITGFVDQVRPSIDSQTHEIRVAGRDKAGDLVDCSEDWRPGEWANLALPQLVAALAAPYGMPVEALAPAGAPIPLFRVEQGETTWEAIERACRLSGLLCVSDGLGGLQLLRPPGPRAAVGLAIGANLLAAGGVFDAVERFSEYVVKAQQASSDFLDESAAAFVVGRASDPGVRRHRPFLRIAEAPAGSGTAQQRAEWEATVRAARSRRAVLTVQGWRQQGSAGALWALNQLVSVTVPDLGLQGRDLVVAEVEYQRGPNGTTTRLTCLDPAAFAPAPATPQAAGTSNGLDAWWNG